MWYVGYLLLNKETIRAKAQEEFSNDYSEFDEYNDLLLVEKKLDEFITGNLITANELNLFNMYFSYSEKDILKKTTTTNIHPVNDNFVNICNRIGYALGGMFTNDGYLEYMKNKYKLNELQVIKLEQYIQSEYKYKLIRELYRGN